MKMNDNFFFSENESRILLLTLYCKMKTSNIWDPKHNTVKSIHMVQSQLVDGKLSWCHLHIVFVSFNSELEQNYNLQSALIFITGSCLSIQEVFVILHSFLMYNTHSTSPSIRPIFLEQIIPFENTGIPQRSYLAFWYENTDGDKVCKIPI